MSHVTNRFWSLAARARDGFDASLSDFEKDARAKEIALDTLVDQWCGPWFDNSSFNEGRQ